MLSKEEKELIKKIGRYKFDKMKRLNMTLEEFEKHEVEQKKISNLRKRIGTKKFYELKAFNMNADEMEEYLKKQKQERELKKHLGYKEYNEFKESKAKTMEEFEEYKRNQRKEKNKKKYIKKLEREEKNKIRFKTIRYIERHCNIERRCQVCGEKAEIHHPNYNDYLKVNLLCKKHHTALHNFELIPPGIIDLEKISKEAKQCQIY